MQAYSTKLVKNGKKKRTLFPVAVISQLLGILYCIHLTHFLSTGNRLMFKTSVFIFPVRFCNTRAGHE